MMKPYQTLQKKKATHLEGARGGTMGYVCMWELPDKI
jgi:hypothetical protein